MGTCDPISNGRNRAFGCADTADKTPPAPRDHRASPRRPEKLSARTPTLGVACGQQCLVRARGDGLQPHSRRRDPGRNGHRKGHHRRGAAQTDQRGGVGHFQVAGQQLSVRATRTILSRLEERFGGHLPSPAEVLSADPQVLHASGLSARKGATLRALAERFVDGRLSDDGLAQMTDEEIEAALTEVSGIGPWTAHGFLIFALDRPDVLLSGDLALRHAVQRLYGLDHLPSEGEMLEVAERWRPYRSLAISYLFASEFDRGAS